MEKKSLNRIYSYLTFILEGEAYSSHISEVLCLTKKIKITKIPHAPDYVNGIINLNGKVLPVIDTRVKNRFSEMEAITKTSIVIMDLNMDHRIVQIGFLIDELEESNVPQYKASFITGVKRIDDRFLMMLDEIMKINETTSN